MKKKLSQVQNENIKFDEHKHRPDIRDDLDSRMHQEQQLKGNDVTHNKKEADNREKRKTKKQ